jgi:DNA-directed RNA polymerase subunit RPC12/RpoP
MTYTNYVCDKCGKHFPVHLRLVMRLGVFQSRHFDLCEECYVKVRRFIKEGA